MAWVELRAILVPDRFMLHVRGHESLLNREEIENLLDSCEHSLAGDNARQRAAQRRALGPGGKKIMRGIGRGIEALIPEPKPKKKRRKA